MKAKRHHKTKKLVQKLKDSGELPSFLPIMEQAEREVGQNRQEYSCQRT